MINFLLCFQRSCALNNTLTESVNVIFLMICDHYFLNVHVDIQVVERLPWNGVGTWLRETWEWMYLSWYMDWGLIMQAVGLAVVLTVMRMTLNFALFKVLWYTCVCILYYVNTYNFKTQASYCATLCNIVIYFPHKHFPFLLNFVSKKE